MKKRRIAFVINPNSGSDRKTDRVELIRQLIGSSYDGEILPWMKVEERDEIFHRVKTEGFDVAVAVGGDGTVSQLADALCGTEITLGIVPFGSGNGLARHLGVPMKTKAAMQLLENGVTVSIDRGHIGEHSFVCTAGIGFDARIGKLFADSPTRGFSTYAGITLRELRNYTPEEYTIELDGKKITRTAFLITIANAGQYGNNAWIAPAASVTDGVFHVALLRPFRWWNIPGVALKMFLKKTDTSLFLETFTAKKVRITRKEAGPVHYDGEPGMLGNTFEATLQPSALKVIVPQGKKI